MLPHGLGRVWEGGGKEARWDCWLIRSAVGSKSAPEDDSMSLITGLVTRQKKPNQQKNQKHFKERLC